MRMKQEEEFSAVGNCGFLSIFIRVDVWPNVLPTVQAKGRNYSRKPKG